MGGVAGEVALGMNILFVGDIVGRCGREALQNWLPEIQEEHSADVTIVNAENAAGGIGVTPDILNSLPAMGVDAVTLGNHTWRKKALIPVINNYPWVVRPANYPKGTPGQGHALITLKDGRTLGLINVLGRVFMEPLDCPFQAVDAALSKLKLETSTLFVDVHAEATSEKVAMGWHLDGRCTAVVGTHTHIPTADERILPEGTAYITDVGMTGPRDSVIGVDKKSVIKKFLTSLPQKFDVANTPPVLCGVAIQTDDRSGKAVSIQRVMKYND